MRRSVRTAIIGIRSEMNIENPTNITTNLMARAAVN
jgi:hypothetical protein